MHTRIKLRYCTAIHCAVFGVILVVINVCKDTEAKYLNYGPNEELRVLSVKIDSMSKYLYLGSVSKIVTCFFSTQNMFNQLRMTVSFQKSHFHIHIHTVFTYFPTCCPRSQWDS